MLQEQKKCVGGISHSRIEYVKQQQGQAGMQKLLERMVENGYIGPRKLDEIMVAKWYPIEYNTNF